MRPITDILPFQSFLPTFRPAGADQLATTPPLFDMLDQVRLLHPPGARGNVVFGQHTGDNQWTQTAVPVEQQEVYAADLIDRVDQYVTCNTFYGRRKKGRVAQLGSCYVDLDYYKLPRWQGARPESVAQEVLSTLQEISYPLPSFMLSSGRGLLVMWLHRLVPCTVLPRWEAVQRELFNALGLFGPDCKALDPSRVFRLIGTRNSKSGKLVLPVYQHPELWTGQRQSFEALAAILPVPRQDVVKRRVTRKRQMAGIKVRPPRVLTRRTYYTALVEDLKRLVEFRWQGHIPDGERNATLLYMTIAMAHVVPVVQLEQEVCAVARTFAGWSRSRTKRMASSVIDRARAGLPMGGDNGPYGLTAKKAIEMLDIKQVEMRSADLRVLIDAQVKQERATERKRRSRRVTGVVPLSEYREERARIIVRNVADTLASVARNGCLQTAAAELGTTIGGLKKRLQRLRSKSME